MNPAYYSISKCAEYSVTPSKDFSTSQPGGVMNTNHQFSFGGSVSSRSETAERDPSDASFDLKIDVCHGELENVKDRAELAERIKSGLISCFWHVQVVRHHRPQPALVHDRSIGRKDYAVRVVQVHRTCHLLALGLPSEERSRLALYH